MMQTFLGGDMVLYAFMALAANIIAEVYRSGAIFGFLVPYIPQAVEMILGVFKIHISLDFIKLSAHMPSVYEASNQLSTFLPCFLVAGGYLLVSFLIGFQRLKGQDIK